jgi:hypothetical protein
MTDKTVVPFKGSDAEPPLQVIERDWSACPHARYDVHPDLSRVFCRDCDATLDPYWVLRRIASDHGQRTWQVEHLKRESAKMEKLIRRRLDNRKSEQHAASDASEAQRLARTSTSPADRFRGDIRVSDAPTED